MRISIFDMNRLCLTVLLSVPLLCTLGLAKEPNGPEGPEQLQNELNTLLAQGVPASSNPQELLKLASVYLDLGYGVYVEKEKKIASFQEGARLAKRALGQKEESAEAHFLYAANLGSAAELEGLVSSALTLKEIKDEVHRVLDLDPSHVQGHHMLGRLLEELPWFLGGDTSKAGQHLKKAVALDSRYVPGRLDLAKWYLKQDQKVLAIEQLQHIVENPPGEKRWIWLLRYRPEAEALLRQFR